MNRKELGDKGEVIAADFLIKKGYRVIETNYLKRAGEIDIVAYDPFQREYVFIEVKTRKNSYFGYPEEFVDESKLDKISNVAHIWLEQNKLENAEWRIDVIALIHYQNHYEIKHLENI